MPIHLAFQKDSKFYLQLFKYLVFIFALRLTFLKEQLKHLVVLIQHKLKVIRFQKLFEDNIISKLFALENKFN